MVIYKSNTILRHPISTDTMLRLAFSLEEAPKMSAELRCISLSSHANIYKTRAENVAFFLSVLARYQVKLNSHEQLIVDFFNQGNKEALEQAYQMISRLEKLQKELDQVAPLRKKFANDDFADKDKHYRNSVTNFDLFSWRHKTEAQNYAVFLYVAREYGLKMNPNETNMVNAFMEGENEHLEELYERSVKISPQ